MSYSKGTPRYTVAEKPAGVALLPENYVATVWDNYHNEALCICPNGFPAGTGLGAATSIANTLNKSGESLTEEEWKSVAEILRQEVTQALHQDSKKYDFLVGSKMAINELIHENIQKAIVRVVKFRNKV